MDAIRRRPFGQSRVSLGVHLRLRRHQELALTEIDQRTLGRRVGPPQPLEHNARRVGAAFGEELTADHLEQIAADERILGALDEPCVFALGVIAAARPDGIGGR